MQLFAINIAGRGNLQGFISSIRKIIRGTCLNIDLSKVQELKNVTRYMNKNKNLLCNGLTEVTITIFSQELFQNLTTHNSEFLLFWKASPAELLWCLQKIIKQDETKLRFFFFFSIQLLIYPHCFAGAGAPPPVVGLKEEHEVWLLEGILNI